MLSGRLAPGRASLGWGAVRRIANRAAGLLTLASDPRYVAHVLPGRAFSLTARSTTASIREWDPSIKTIIDVGANIGQFAVAAGYEFPRAEIHSYEPVPDAYERLVANTRHLASIHPVRVAVGKTNETREMFINDNTQVSSMLRIAASNTNPGYRRRVRTTMPVDVRTLDSILSEQSFARPLLLKLDVQGYEPDVLRGAAHVIDQVDWLMCEMPFAGLYDGQMTFDDLHALLHDLGFRVAVALRLGFGSRRSPIEADFLYRRLG